MQTPRSPYHLSRYRVALSRNSFYAVGGYIFAEQAVVLIHHDLVALARFGFELSTIKDRYRTACIFDNASFLQMSGRDRDALAPDAQHVGYQLLCHHELVRDQLVMIYEQPTAKLLFDAVQPIADGRLRDLGN